MKNREHNVAAWIARQNVRKLRAQEALGELERAQRATLESRKRLIQEAHARDKAVETRKQNGEA